MAEQDRYVEGPWSSEPKRTAFEHTGFPCITLKARSHWCGYVGVPPGHPWHGKTDSTIYGEHDEEWNRIEPTWPTPEVHGGVTYGRGCDGDPVHGVCHVAANGEPDDVWWIGFDCAHSGNFMPPLKDMARKHPDLFRDSPREGPYPFGETYKDLAYVQAECRSLAEQARTAHRASEQEKQL